MNSIFDMQPPFLNNGMIEYQANALLRSYEAMHGTIDTLYTPTEEILEQTLGYSLEVDDFTRSQYFGNIGDDVLGFIDVKAKAIFINKNIDPMENPNALEGRFYFTVAHEIGHGVLHEELMTEFYAQIDFWNDDEQKHPTILCRNPDNDSTAQRPFVELQADKFAGYFLMPAEKVTIAMQKHFGSDTPLTFAALESMGGVNKALSPMAESMRVSKQALAIRLKKMNLLTDGSQGILL
jgi:Zn-dependent peptidase ImmA (M78 family)